MRTKSLVLAVSLILSTAIPAGADTVVTLTLDAVARPPLFGASSPVQQSYILVTAGPIPPIICYVLSPGGGGGLFVADGQLGVNSNNFLVRTRHLLAGAAQLGEDDDEPEQGSCVAVLDAATDFLSRPDGLRGFRLSVERFLDIAAVIADLRRGDMFGNNIRIVLDGTSRGTIDMAEYAARAGAGPVDEPVDALVLSSTLTDPRRITDPTNATDNVFNSDLSEVRVPTLLLFHEDDACFVTPPEDVELVKAQLVNAPKVEVRGFEGGFPPVDTNDCRATTFHGFLGKEPEVIREIVKFVNEVLEGAGDNDDDGDD